MPEQAGHPATPASHGKKSIVLFAHGSRDALWRLPIEAVAQTIREREPDAAVRCAYLELCEPDLRTAATDLIATGSRSIRVFPLFLGVGKHAREDLPLLVGELRAAYPDVNIELMATAGENPALVALMADIALAPVEA
ncbi:MAG: cobalamin [Polaromonas sp.]|jgi:sirohydrochlorin cobaltochelatase|nr:cobalamin [Polaromonas sp.]